MEPKEKAKELVNKFQDKIEIDYEQYSNYFIKIELSEQAAKACALITVDEILDILGGVGVYSFADSKVSEYWEEVKTEIVY